MDKPIVTNKDEYLKQVKNIKKNISTGYFQKSVLSRINLVKGNFLSIASLMFHEACRRHPNAFVYLFKSGEHFWLGASPEPLLRFHEGVVSTVSLAGTRPYSKMNREIGNWTMKEVLEQEYVTRYIHDILREFNIRDYRVTSPYVKKAADLVHLRSDFSFKYEHISGRIRALLDALHPTPAVAGQPKDEAVTFIKQLEPHDREYYTGFLGPVQSDEIIDLFVNLRCMKITPDYLALYIGGGITLESVPEDEWEETELKAKSLLNIIDILSKQTDDKPTFESTHR
jgi:isochorismate synthase